jgi:hypothetical protein
MTRGGAPKSGACGLRLRLPLKTVRGRLAISEASTSPRERASSAAGL